VMPTHRRTGLKHVFLGSTAEIREGIWGEDHFAARHVSSDTSIRLKALLFTISPVCKGLRGKLPNAKCESSCAR
jgi:hypothetical protein